MGIVQNFNGACAVQFLTQKCQTSLLRCYICPPFLRILRAPALFVSLTLYACFVLPTPCTLLYCHPLHYS